MHNSGVHGAKIFINYRNGDHTPLVNELYEQLAHHFGADQVFLDRYTIRPGGRYPNELRDGVAHADVLISIIHREWLKHSVTKPDCAYWTANETGFARNSKSLCWTGRKRSSRSWSTMPRD